MKKILLSTLLILSHSMSYSQVSPESEGRFSKLFDKKKSVEKVEKKSPKTIKKELPMGAPNKSEVTRKELSKEYIFPWTFSLGYSLSYINHEFKSKQEHIDLTTFGHKLETFINRLISPKVFVRGEFKYLMATYDDLENGVDRTSIDANTMEANLKVIVKNALRPPTPFISASFFELGIGWLQSDVDTSTPTQMMSYDTYFMQLAYKLLWGRGQSWVTGVYLDPMFSYNESPQSSGDFDYGYRTGLILNRLIRIDRFWEWSIGYTPEYTEIKFMGTGSRGTTDAEISELNHILKAKVYYSF